MSRKLFSLFLLVPALFALTSCEQKEGKKEAPKKEEVKKFDKNSDMDE